MARFKRTFKTKAPLVKYEIEEEIRQVETLRDSKLPFYIYFNENEKLMSFYVYTLMTGNFMGVNAPNAYSKTSMSPVVDEYQLKVIFNTIYTIIKYFNVRYKKHPELVERFIKSRVQFTVYDMVMTLSNFSSNYKTEAIPTQLRPYFEDWEFLNKINKEIVCMERVGEIYSYDLFYQILHYYYYDCSMDPLPTPADTDLPF